MNGHHLTVHRQWLVGAGTAAAATAGCRLDGNETRLGRLLRMILLILVLLLQRLHLQLQRGDGLAIQAAVGNTAMLEGAAVKAWLVAVVAGTDYLPTAHDDGTVAKVEGGLGSLLEAKREIVVSLHICRCEL